MVDLLVITRKRQIELFKKNSIDEGRDGDIIFIINKKEFRVNLNTLSYIINSNEFKSEIRMQAINLIAAINSDKYPVIKVWFTGLAKDFWWELQAEKIIIYYPEYPKNSKNISYVILPKR